MSETMAKLTPQGAKELNVPNEWTITSLFEIRDKTDHYSFTGGPFGSDLKTSDYTDSGVRVIQLQNIGDGKFMNQNKIFTSNIKADELSSSNIFPGDIIIAKMAEPLARACIIPSMENRFVMASDGIRLKVNEYKFDKNFIYYYINSEIFRKEAIRKGSGSTRLRIGLSDLKTIPVAHPDIIEQSEIGEILSVWDKAIELKQQLIDVKKEQKKGLMQKLLKGEVRLSGFEKEWRTTKMSSCIDIINGYPFKSEFFNNNKNGVPLIRIRDIKSKELKTYYSGDYTKDYLINRNDIIIGMDGEFNIIKWNKITGLLNQRVMKIEAKHLIDEYFIFQLLKPKLKRIEHITPATTVKHLSNKDVNNLKIKIPDFNEQKAIGHILRMKDKQIRLLEEELKALKVQKKGLMQQLLTGRVRVKV